MYVQISTSLKLCWVKHKDMTKCETTTTGLWRLSEHRIHVLLSTLGGPCQLMSQELERVSVDMKDSLRVVKVDCDRYPNLATKYGIGGLPTVVLFKNGSPVMKEVIDIQNTSASWRLHLLLNFTFKLIRSFIFKQIIQQEGFIPANQLTVRLRDILSQKAK